jgi:hypothetical protein
LFRYTPKADAILQNMWYIKIFGRYTIGVLSRSNYKMPPTYTSILVFNINHPMYLREWFIDSCVSVTWKDVLVQYVDNKLNMYIHNNSRCSRVSVDLSYNDIYIYFFS